MKEKYLTIPKGSMENPSITKTAWIDVREDQDLIDNLELAKKAMAKVTLDVRKIVIHNLEASESLQTLFNTLSDD